MRKNNHNLAIIIGIVAAVCVIAAICKFLF